jgi:HK97 family phage prohead protease
MDEKDKTVKREVGERVDVMFNIDQSTVKELGDGCFSATVTTTDKDRYGEVIDTAGVDIKAYMDNPVVLYGHDYQGLPIGKTLKLTKSKDPDTGEKNKMNATFQLAVNEYPFAATVAALIKGGYLNAVSIGGLVTAWSGDYMTILGMEMVEFSVVPVPANPAAIITGKSFEKAAGKTIAQVAREYHEFVEKSVADKLKGIDGTELTSHIENLEGLLAILKDTATGKVIEKDESEPEKVRLTLRKTASKVSQTGLEIIKLTTPKE